MVAADIIPNGLARRINIFCLLLAIAAILILPFKKEIWYDETVTILCSKGISHDTPGQFANATTITSTEINALNTVPNVFNATVLDNGNSFLYNIGLHWFTWLFGNSLSAYTLFSKLCCIAALLAFFVLCRLLLKDSIFTAVAVVFLATDNNFIGMSHEIRAYSMGIFFVTIAAVYFYKFMYQHEKPLYLFLLGLFSVAAILSHFLSVYIILVFFFVLLFTKRMALFTARNILAMLVPIGILALFFYFSFSGLQQMNVQNNIIRDKFTAPFSLWEVLIRSTRFAALNFKAAFPAFTASVAVSLISFLFIVAIYIVGLKAAHYRSEEKALSLFFVLGISSSLFLAALSIKAHHYTSLYNRYYSFGVPFGSLCMAYALYIFSRCRSVHRYITIGTLALLLIPSCALFVIGIKRASPKLAYNHNAIARQITTNKITKIAVPIWKDAFLVHSFLPDGYKIDYFRSEEVYNFILYKATGTEQVPVFRHD